MNKIAKDAFAPVVAPQFTEAEVAQLRALMKVARYDEQERAFVLEAGGARLALREDGTVRIEGGKIIQVSQSTIVLNAAAIELN